MCLRHLEVTIGEYLEVRSDSANKYTLRKVVECVDGVVSAFELTGLSLVLILGDESLLCDRLLCCELGTLQG